MMDADGLIELMSQGGKAGQGGTFRLGTVDPDYVAGRPKIVFDGETTASGKQYPYLSGYSPGANDKVLLAAVSGGYVVIGKIV